MDLLKARLLSDHWLAGGEIAGAPLAEPTTTQAHVHILGHRELASRPPDIRAVTLQGLGDLIRIFDTPPVAFEHLHGSGIIYGQGQGKFLSRAPGQLEEFSKTRDACSRSNVRRYIPGL